MLVTATLFILTFSIYRTDNDHAWERGTVIATSCDVARQYIIDGLKPNQEVLFERCVERN